VSDFVESVVEKNVVGGPEIFARAQSAAAARAVFWSSSEIQGQEKGKRE
jgi:hypothetical protein